MHEECLAQINNLTEQINGLNQELESAQRDVTNISLVKNRLESEVISLRTQLQSVSKNVVRITAEIEQRSCESEEINEHSRGEVQEGKSANRKDEKGKN